MHGSRLTKVPSGNERWRCYPATSVDVTSAVWRNSVARVGGPDRRTQGVGSPCRRSLTLVEDALNPVGETASEPGAHSVPLLVQPTRRPLTLPSARGQ